MENHIFFIGNPSIHGPFPMAMLNNQRVHCRHWEGVRHLTIGMVSPAGTEISIQDPNPATIMFCNDQTVTCGNVMFFFQSKKLNIL